jgi:hypothetical protein
MLTTPIALFVYNRPDHTRRTIEALKANELAAESDLFIFSDGPKGLVDDISVKQVRAYIKKIDGFKCVKIEERAKNIGLASSVISGVSVIINRYGEVIVLEDDCITADSFLTFMNQALNHYKEDHRVGSVTGYSLPISIPMEYPWPVYLTRRHSSWGWGTYDHVWNGIDWNVSDYNQFRQCRDSQREFNAAGNDMVGMLERQMVGKSDSWSIRFDYSCYRRGLLSLASTDNLLMNIGFDNTGVHCSPKGRRLQREFGGTYVKRYTFPDQIELYPWVEKGTQRLFHQSLWARIIRKVFWF